MQLTDDEVGELVIAHNLIEDFRTGRKADDALTAAQDILMRIVVRAFQPQEETT